MTSCIAPSAAAFASRALGRVGWRGLVWSRSVVVRVLVVIACVVWFVAGVAYGQQEYQVIAVPGAEAPVAWWYPDHGLVLALGVAEVRGASVPLARRAAVIDAQETLVRAYATLQGWGHGPLAATIENMRVIAEERGSGVVYVFLVARAVDIRLETSSW